MSFPRHPTASLDAFLTFDHRHCDEAWADVENAAPAEVPARLEVFDRLLRRHLGWEEEVLFPAWEKATGMYDMGPTAVMRLEHASMRSLLKEMAEAAAAGDAQEVLDLGDTLLMLIQQHNLKEEGMLYPAMVDRVGDQWPALLARLRPSVD